MALWMPESKFRDHFSIQTSPQNPQKATSGTKIGPQKVIFGHFINWAIKMGSHTRIVQSKWEAIHVLPRVHIHQ